MRTLELQPQSVEQSLAFLRNCLQSTPLRHYTELFSEDRVMANEAVTASMVEGLEQFQSDLARVRWEIEDPQVLFEKMLMAPTVQAVYFYRISHAMFRRDVSELPNVIATLSRLMTSMEIYYSATIGPGLKVIHGIGTIIGAHSRIGSHFTIYQNVTIGDKLGRDTGVEKRPVIGDYVIASTGAQIVGPVKIGSRSIIGANAVVLRSIPPRCIAAGVPAEVKVADMSDESFAEYWDALNG